MLHNFMAFLKLLSDNDIVLKRSSSAISEFRWVFHYTLKSSKRITAQKIHAEYEIKATMTPSGVSIMHNLIKCKSKDTFLLTINKLMVERFKTVRARKQYNLEQA